MHRIMFVCHGNICRSPMAEFILKDLVKKAGLNSEFEIASAATSTEEIGNPIYPEAKAELKRHGIIPDIGKRAVRLKADDYGCYELFIVMDSENIRNIRKIFPADPENKIHKLLEYAGRSGDVADPWYSRRFDIAYEDIYSGCTGLLKRLTDK